MTQGLHLIGLVLGVLHLSYAIECPKGVFLSASGNDTTGDGTEGAPFGTFRRCLESLQQRGALDAVISVLPGIYTESTASYQIGPFNSITLAPANKTDSLPVLHKVHYMIYNTTKSWIFVDRKLKIICR
eukprot:TRINITY_DN20808_c0_g1_i1.p1 TRINITY_DN20808_c0_g1~~TRINITY_DN20808_c0_g1_i1.p1  ORF type:complete len:129 (+),score=1.46 TRINITY_DN20808_c0_g1_i1:3-389(+)